MGRATAIFFTPLPAKESKGQISFNFNYSQFQRFLCQTLCVISQMKDTKHRQDFHSVPGVGLWGAEGAQGVKKKISFGISNQWDDEQNRPLDKIQPNLVCKLLI